MNKFDSIFKRLFTEFVVEPPKNILNEALHEKLIASSRNKDGSDEFLTPNECAVLQKRYLENKNSQDPKAKEENDEIRYAVLGSIRNALGRMCSQMTSTANGQDKRKLVEEYFSWAEPAAIRIFETYKPESLYSFTDIIFSRLVGSRFWESKGVSLSGISGDTATASEGDTTINDTLTEGDTRYKDIRFMLMDWMEYAYELNNKKPALTVGGDMFTKLIGEFKLMCLAASGNDYQQSQYNERNGVAYFHILPQHNTEAIKLPVDTINSFDDWGVEIEGDNYVEITPEFFECIYETTFKRFEEYYKAKNRSDNTQGINNFNIMDWMKKAYTINNGGKGLVVNGDMFNKLKSEFKSVCPRQYIEENGKSYFVCIQLKAGYTGGGFELPRSVIKAFDAVDIVEDDDYRYEITPQFFQIIYNTLINDYVATMVKKESSYIMDEYLKYLLI